MSTKSIHGIFTQEYQGVIKHADIIIFPVSLISPCLRGFIDPSIVSATTPNICPKKVGHRKNADRELFKPFSVYFIDRPRSMLVPES